VFDQSVVASVESTFPQWSKQLFEQLQNLYPPSPDFLPLPDDSLPPSTVLLESVSTTPADQATGTSTHERMEIEVKWASDCKWARLIKNERVTKKGWWQDVREIEIEVEDDETVEEEQL